MSKFFSMFLLSALLTASLAWAQEANSADVETSEEAVNSEGLVHYGTHTTNVPNVKALTAEEDDLYDGSDIKPLRGTLSQAEKTQKGGGFEDDDEPRLPDLQCSDEKLREQVGKFVYEFSGRQIKNTVPARREQILMIRNMKTFEEVQEADIKKNFEASAALIYLKMNENREIYRICVSKNNSNRNFKDFYIILYPYLNFYKVVVTNLISAPEHMNEATFIYNW